VLHGGLVGGVDLVRIVSAPPQLVELLVGQMFDHFQQPRVGAEEAFAEVGAGLHRVFLIQPVHGFAHALDEHAVLILGEEWIPIIAPEDLDDIPAGAAEDGLELLNDAAIAAHGAVQPLEIAVDDEDEVVELFA
jgi:hypothetical protein